jgi:chaperonin GroES
VSANARPARIAGPRIPRTGLSGTSSSREPFSAELIEKEEKTVNIRPLHDRVIVRRLEEERKTPGGIVIPDTAKEKPIQGEVIAVGKGKILEDGKVRPLDVKAGDRILFGKYSGTEVKVGNEELLVMREEDIMGIVEK